MTLKELWLVSPQSEVFVRDRSIKTGKVFAARYTGGKANADRQVLTVTAKSYPMYESVLEVVLK